ncbi:F-box only protein 21-like [Centruroides sculpturatus]|uniref:F-box only protein 21-like n=1 Tax=Centruroides sculpturatus TaxID=218467 RepID=UPI000C6D381F|nr:F-box only protein 21-like [Centruroides sculpturatus]
MLEKGAILLAQWCQPTERISEDDVISQLEYLTHLTKNELQIRHPKHPLLQTELIRRDVSLENSLWQPADCRSILSCITTVLFNQQEFNGNRDDYYSALNSYIDQVLTRKTGIPITLCIIYASIARRLGVVCHPVNFPGHFLLKWQEHPSLPTDQKYTFIDAFDYGKFLSQKDCKDLVPGYYSPMAENWYNTIEPIQVFKRMCWNLVDVGRQQESMGDGLMCLRNALELLAILSPDDVEHQLLLARVYLHLNINLTKVMSLLQGISSRDPTSVGIVDYVCQAAQSQMALQRSHQQTKKVKIKHRNNNLNIEYAVGMIMRHKKYNYICVIYGWDPICEASRDWIYQMGVYNLPHKEKQPFYNVLVEDGSNRYAAQENLELTEYPKPISHPEIGKYFQHYCTTHYVPNEEKEAEYPEDKSIREEVIAKHFPQERED